MVRAIGTCSTVLTVSAVALLVGCSGESAPMTQPAVSHAASTSQGPSESGTPLPEGVVLMSDLTEGSAVVPGRYAGVVGGSSRSGELPLAVVTVPSGYLAGGASGVFVDEGGFRHLDLWTVSKVVRDPCSGPVYTDPGPTVQELADALTALPVWESTKPKPVTVGGYQGLVMDFNVPDPTPDGCGDEPYHWVDEMGGTQGLGPGKHERLWILDVAGKRVMILAGWFPAGGSDPAAGVTAAKAKELVGMAESITFVEPDA